MLTRIQVVSERRAIAYPTSAAIASQRTTAAAAAGAWNKPKRSPIKSTAATKNSASAVMSERAFIL